jgi:hypothetical protein
VIRGSRDDYAITGCNASCRAPMMSRMGPLGWTVRLRATCPLNVGRERTLWAREPLSRLARCSFHRLRADASGRGGLALGDEEARPHLADGPSASTDAPVRVADRATPVAYAAAVAIAMATCART